MTATILQEVAGFLLVFVVPGYTVTKALFPEWRIRGPEALLRTVEIGTLSLLLSVTFTILVGFILGNLPGALFQASWTNPLLETVLAAVTMVAVVVGLLNGAYRREPPRRTAAEPAPGEDRSWELLETMDALHRQERRLRHQLRAREADDPDRGRLEAELRAVKTRGEELRRAREAEYAQ